MLVDPSVRDTKIVADARLDGLDDLRSELGLDPAKDTSETILAAYLRWHGDCVHRLRGEFAFAIWDPALGRLFCARDPLGVHPFAYSAGPSRFLFASTPQILRAVPGAGGDLDPLAVAYLLLDRWDDPSFTFSKGIKRLPPGNSLSVGLNGAVVLHDYWSERLRTIQAAPLESDMTQRFRELFMRAVARRIPEEGPFAAELSGGLDSSAVSAASAAVAPHDRLTLAIAAFDDPTLDDGHYDEGRYREPILRAFEGQTLQLPGSEAVSIGAIDEAMSATGWPIAGAMLLVHLALYQRLASLSIRIVLDGFDGDSTVSYGTGRLIELLIRGRVTGFAREVVALGRTSGLGALRVALQGVALPIGGHVAFRLGVTPDVRYSLASRQLLDSTGVRELLRREERVWPGDVERKHLQRIRSGTTAFGLETRDALAGSVGIKVLHPLFDVDLVEFCLGLPSEQFLRNGYGRWIFRQAMKGIVAEQVLTRQQKGGLSPAFVARVVDAYGPNALSDILRGPAAEFVDHQRTRDAIRGWLARQDIGSSYALLPVLALNRWLGATDVVDRPPSAK
jgi:asparagine synthase (glutamine-hydrolysing)